MGLRLGRTEQVKITVKENDGSSSSVLFTYRDPSTDAYIAFRTVMAHVMPEIRTSKDEVQTISSMSAMDMSVGFRDLALSCIIGISGIEDENGIELATPEALEALKTCGEGSVLLEGLGQHIFEKMRRLEVQTGKDVKVSD